MAFNYESKYFKTLGRVADCMVIGIFWLVSSIPLITMGAASAAMYYTYNKGSVRNYGYLWKTYKTSFLSNFKRATLAWLLWLFIACLIALDLWITRKNLEAGYAIGWFYYSFLAISLLMLTWCFFLFPYIARFEDSLKQTLIKSVTIMISNIGWGLLLSFIFVFLVVFFNEIPPLFLLLPGLFTMIKNFILEKIFRKYMRKQDLELELKQDRENI